MGTQVNSFAEKREDFVTAATVSEGMALLAEVGREGARTYFANKGVKAELAERMLLMGYDRRRVATMEKAL